MPYAGFEEVIEEPKTSFGFEEVVPEKQETGILKPEKATDRTDPADLVGAPAGYEKANLTAPPLDMQQHEKDLNSILNWDDATPEERARIREEETQGMARLMKENPPAKALANATGSSVVGKTAQALINLTDGKDAYPTFLHAVQAVNDKGLTQSDDFKGRFFTETLPKLAADSPLYMALGYLTKGWGTFTAMNALEQALDKYNTGKEFDEQKLKTSLVTDLLFKAVPGFSSAAGGPAKRLLAETGNIAKGTAILTGTGVMDKGLNNEDITLKGTAEDALGNALLVGVMHVPQLVKSGKAGLIEQAAAKAGMPEADATQFANTLVNGKKNNSMRIVTDLFKGDESKIRQFAKAFRAEFGEAGLVNRAQYAAEKSAEAQQQTINRPLLTEPETVRPQPAAPTPAPAAPTAEDVILSRSQTETGLKPGAPTVIYGAKGTQYPANYAVVPRSLIQASHDGQSFAKNPEYPLENTRDYSKPGEQEKVISVRNGFDPARHVTDSPDAAVGPSMVARVIGEDGVARMTVLGGNNREMAIATMSPEKKQQLAEFTNQRAERFGVPQLSSPDEELVRYMGEFDLRKEGQRGELQKVVDSLNPSPGKMQNLAEMATVDASNSFPVEQLARVPMDLTPEDAQGFLANAIKAGALDRNLRSQIAEHPQQAAEYVRRLMVNAAFRSPELAEFHAATDAKGTAARGLVESAVPSLVEMRSKGLNELADAFTRSMQTIVHDFGKTGKLDAALTKAAQQMEMDPRYRIVNEVAGQLSGLIELNKRGGVDVEATLENFSGFWNRMQAAMRQYSAESDMFGAERTPEEVIRELMGRGTRNIPESNRIIKENNSPIDIYRTAHENAGDEEVKAYLEARGVEATPKSVREARQLYFDIGLRSPEPLPRTGRTDVPERQTGGEVRNGGSVDREAARRLFTALANPESTSINPAEFKAVFDAKPTVSAVIHEMFSGEKTAWPISGMSIRSPQDVAALALSLRSPFQESMKVVYLDAQNKVIDARVVSLGTLNSSLVHPVLVFGPSPEGTDHVILSHNHPSGDPTPSAPDIKITEALKAAAESIGLRVSDHVITNGTKYFSFSDMAESAFAKPVLADWEAIPANQLPKMRTPLDAQAIGTYLRTADPGASYLYLLNTKNALVGVHRFNPSTTPEEIVRIAVQARNAAMVVVDVAKDLPDAIRLSRQLSSRFSDVKIGLTDVLSNQNGTFLSLRDEGIYIPEELRKGNSEKKDDWSIAEEQTPYSLSGKPELDAPVAVRFTEAGALRQAKLGDWQKMKLGGLEFVRTMEMPELLKLSRMMGVEPTLKKLPKAYGHMKPVPGAPQIALDPRIFKDPINAARVFAHEIGHLTDFMPDETMKRGNILGRIYSLREFRKNVLRGESEVTAKEMQKELYELSKWWRPFDESRATTSFLKYRKSSAETYADALSVLLNSPAELKTRAPKFWNAFFKTIERKPEVKADLIQLWDGLQRPESDRLKDRSAEIRRMFGAGEEILMRKAKERELRFNTFRGWTDRFKMQYSDVYYPIVKRTRALKAQGKRVAWHEDPEMLFDEHPLAADNVSYRFMDRLYKKVIQPLEAAGLSQEQLGEFMMLNRILNEELIKTVENAAGEPQDMKTGRQVLANPLGIQPPQARKQLLNMRLGLGIEKMTLLEDFARFYQDMVFRVTQDAVEAGTYNREYVEGTLAKNKYNYATFAVLDHLEHNDHIPAGIKKQVGSFKNIANPLTASMLKMQTLMKWNQVNRAHSAAIDVMAEWDEAERAPVKMAGGRTFPKPAPSGKVLFSRMVNGNPEHWYVDPEVPAMFEHRSPAEQDAILQVLNSGFRKVIYPLWITYNPAFNMLMNPIRDFRRTHRNMPAGGSATGLKLIKEYAANRKSAVRRLKHESDPLISEMLENFAIGSPFDSFNSNVYRDDFFGKMLQKFQMMPEPEQTKWKQKWFTKPMISLLKQIEFQGQVMESLPKIASYKILTRDLGWDPRTSAQYVRNYLGTPNYMKRGKHAYGGGTLAPFYNIFLRGWESDLKTATDPKTRFGFWTKWASTSGMWTTLKALAAAGVFGVALKEWFDGVSEYNKTNYDLIPLGKTFGGEFGRKSVGLRIPKDEFSRFVDGVLYKAVYGMATGNLTEQQWNQVFALGAGQVPGLTPFYELGSAWTDYLSGNNPYDHFYNSPVLTNDAWLEGGWESMKGMIGWTAGNLGINNYIRFNPNADSVTEAVLSSTPVLNKAMFISDYGFREQQQAEDRAEDRVKAIIRNDMSREVIEAKNEYYRLMRIGDARTPEQQDRFEESKIWFQTEYSPAWDEILMSIEEGNIESAKRIAKGIRRAD